LRIGLQLLLHTGGYVGALFQKKSTTAGELGARKRWRA
jgi:hypothetical protein